MRPLETSPLVEICFDCTEEEIFMSLEKMRSGYPLPSNVLSDVNPYNCAPTNLPDGFWYLTHSKQSGNTEFGIWKVKGEPCMLFTNPDINGWRTTLELFVGQFPQEHKTDWVMQEYWISQKGLGANSKVDGSLCRVFVGGKQGLDYEEEHKLCPCIASDNCINNHRSNGSPSKPAETQVDKDNGAGQLSMTTRIEDYWVENLRDIDYLSSGDYLELDDLDNPASPSSSSENSSCFTMSSDEYFDPAALLQELESDITLDIVQNNRDCKFSVSAPCRPYEVVLLPASPGRKQPSVEEILRTDSSKPDLSSSCNSKAMDYDPSQYAVGNQKSNSRDDGSSSNSCKSTTSSINVEKDNKGIKRKAKNKYLCFMPFYFLF